MFMVGTTQLSDDTVNEVIATYSRGGRSSRRRRTPCSRRRSWRSFSAQEAKQKEKPGGVIICRSGFCLCLLTDYKALLTT